MGKRLERSAAPSARFAASSAACAIACIAVGFASSALAPRDDWYDALRKPIWTPPGWLFGVVWTVLYAMMGIALSIILARGRHRGVGRATTLFAIQLALNAAWSPVFFGLHSIDGALAIVVLLWLLLAWTVAAFWSVRDAAGVLLVPYWLWVTFATALNAAIWRMNG